MAIPQSIAQSEVRKDVCRSAPLPSLLRVLYVVRLTPGQKFGSIEEQIVELASEFRRHGGLFLPLFVADEASSLATFTSRNVPCLCKDLSVFSPLRIVELARLLRHHRIEVVHWNLVEPILNPYIWALAIAAPGVKHWFTDHNSRVPPLAVAPVGLRRQLKRAALRRYDRVVSVSDYVRTCLEAQDVWPAPRTLLHFINTARFAPDAVARTAVRAREGVEDKVVVISVGQLIAHKGMDVAIRAFAGVPEPAVLWLVGAGPGKPALEAEIARLGLQARVRIMPLQADVTPLLQAADVFICPSRWHEAAGLVNIEAQACGLPVVASDVGGIPEYVDRDVTGLLVPPGDEFALQQAITRLVDGPALRASMGAAARRLAVTKFGLEAGMKRMLAFYSKPFHSKEL